MAEAVWNGSLRLSLVSCAIYLSSATSAATVSGSNNSGGAFNVTDSNVGGLTVGAGNLNAAAGRATLQADALTIESEQEVFAAMTALRDGRGEFADALIGALGAKSGCSRTLTFDRKAVRLPGFALA